MREETEFGFDDTDGEYKQSIHCRIFFRDKEDPSMVSF
jgi:hypothetical protein